MRLDIIGAGIGGLTTAIALKRKNINARIFEQAEALKPVGAGIILANNAMQVYDRLGLRKEIVDNGHYISSINLTDRQLNPISKTNLKHFEDKYGVQNIAIHRAKLQQILASQVKDNLTLNHRLQKIEKTDGGLNLEFNNNIKIQSKNIIAADGINSIVRKMIFKTGEIRDAHQICWRGIADFDMPKKYQHELNEAWGLGDRFGFVKIDDSKVYWYALKDSNSNKKTSVEELHQEFKDYNPLVIDIIKNTPVSSIHTAKIEDLKPMSTWHQDNICLIGDAAHATTPNLGQGACQAIEDAHCLANCLDLKNLNSSFQRFQKLRMPKAHRIVNTSWTLGKVSHWKNPIAVKVRNGLMKLTPESINRRQSAKIFELDYS